MDFGLGGKLSCLFTEVVIHQHLLSGAEKNVYKSLHLFQIIHQSWKAIVQVALWYYKQNTGKVVYFVAKFWGLYM